MKKPVPDPPSHDLTRIITRGIPFGAPHARGKHMFSVSEGICAEEALLHTCQLLGSIRASAYDLAQHLTVNDQALALGIAEQLEMAKALVDAVLGGRVS